LLASASSICSSNLPDTVIGFTTLRIRAGGGCIQRTWPEIASALTVSHCSKLEVSTIIQTANPQGTAEQGMFTHRIRIRNFRHFVFRIVQIPPHVATVQDLGTYVIDVQVGALCCRFAGICEHVHTAILGNGFTPGIQVGNRPGLNG
jgi:hypothetical protein